MLSGLRYSSVVAILALLGHIPIFGQNASPGARLTIFPPPNISIENVHVRYALYGAFGAYGSFVDPKPGSSAIEIPLYMERKAATEVRAFAWAPGCRIETFKISLQGLDVHRSYSCEPLDSITLSGRIRNPEIIQERHAEMRVGYAASWACGFFGFGDCIVPGFSVATVTMSADGNFSVDIPHFASDPITSDLASGSEFEVDLREVQTGNLIASLQPEERSLRAPVGSLKILSAYPRPTVFIAATH